MIALETLWKYTKGPEDSDYDFISSPRGLKNRIEDA
jgi:hypothetical protein